MSYHVADHVVVPSMILKTSALASSAKDCIAKACKFAFSLLCSPVHGLKGCHFPSLFFASAFLLVSSLFMGAGVRQSKSGCLYASLIRSQAVSK